MSRKSLFVLSIVAVLALLLVAPAAAQDKVVVTWFVGLGTGTNAEQIEAQNQVVADFNASQSEIELVLNIAASNETSRDTLSTLIAAGTPPDIVGPVGFAGSNSFADQWLDISPLIEASGFDLSVYDPSLIELYRLQGGGLSGLPFAVFPSVTYYNRGLFEEAGLEFPPSEFGAPYILDGEEVPWNYETVREIAKILTVDANGLTPNDEGFDADNIVQFGLNFNWAAMRLILTQLYPASYYNEETGEVAFPDEWTTAAQWHWENIWTYHITPNATYQASEVLQPNLFASGNIAMAIVPLWYTCCLDNAADKFEFDIAPVPANLTGEQQVPMDADTFKITKGSANPEAAFTVLQYLVTDAAPTLATAYGAYPALPAAQQSWIDTISARYPWDVSWSVAADSLGHVVPGPLHHESNVPNYAETYERERGMLTLIEGDTGADIDVAAEMETFEADLAAIIAGS
jgi:multiple sugar transport system substrate-binding protein